MEVRWGRVTRFRLNNKVRESRYWESEEKKEYRICSKRERAIGTCMGRMWERGGRERRKLARGGRKDFGRGREGRGLDEKSANEKGGGIERKNGKKRKREEERGRGRERRREREGGREKRERGGEMSKRKRGVKGQKKKEK